MNILITGGAGYIGSVLIPDLLHKREKVTVLDSFVFGASHLINELIHRPTFTVIQGDICVEHQLYPVLRDQDVIIHLAALSFTEDRFHDIIQTVNFDATKKLVDNLAPEQHLIFMSTCSVYGSQPGATLTEESQTKPTNPYAKSKLDAEDYIRKHHKNHTILRSSTVFGLSPRMRFDLVVNELTLKATLAKKIEIGNPKASRPGVYNRELCYYIYQMAKERHLGTFNAGGVNYTKQQLADTLKEHIPSLEITYKEKESDSRDYLVSFEKLKSTLGVNFASSPIEQGIKEVKRAVELELFKKPFSPIYQNYNSYQEYYHV